jgi:hypothetical protein
MTTFQYEIRYLQAGLDLLEDYLLSDDLYGRIGINPSLGEPDYPTLTVGMLLLFRQRARVLAGSSAEQAELSHLESDLEGIRVRLLPRWEKKAAAEFRSRIRLWGNYLEEYRLDPTANHARYSYEVSRRVMLEWLKDETGEVDQTHVDTLQGLDMLLKGMFLTGSFIWDEALMAGFPVEPYWYLYGRLPEKR